MVKATPDQAHDLLNFKAIGQEAFDNLVKIRSLKVPTINAPVREKKATNVHSNTQKKDQASRKEEEDNQYRNDKLVTTLAQCFFATLSPPCILKCCKVVTRWWQGCHKVATMHFVTTLAQPCIFKCCKVVTRWWQGCHKVATMHFVTTLAQPCILKCCKVVTRWWQGFHKVATMHFVTTLAQPCILKLLQGCYKVMTRLSQDFITIFYYETVTRLSNSS